MDDFLNKLKALAQDKRLRIVLLLQAEGIKFAGDPQLRTDRRRLARAHVEDPGCRRHAAQVRRRAWKRGAASLPTLALLALALLACERSPYRPANDEPATIYMEACLPCHQGGAEGPSLAGRGLTAAAVEARLDRGGKGMPSFPRIRGEARRRLVAFVVNMSGQEPRP